MPISVSCGDCGREYNVKDDAAGRKFKCKDCGSTVDVPANSTPNTSGADSSGASNSARASGSSGGFRDEDFGLPGESNFDDDFGGIPPRRTKSKNSRSSSSGSDGKGLGQASMWIGIVVWGLGLLSILIFAITIGASFDDLQRGGPPPDNVAAGFAFGVMSMCAYTYCLAPLGTITGTVLGVVSLTQGSGGKTQAIVGLVLNAGLLLVGAGLMLFGVLAAAANR